MPLLLKSCVDACQCHVPESSKERSGNMNFQLEERHEKTILLKFQTPKWRKSETIRLFCARASCALASSKQRQVTLEEVSCSVLFG